MARYRKVDVRVWGDERIRRLSVPPPNGRDLWLYLLTARESTSIPGVIPAGAAALAESLRWPVEGFRKAFAELEREGLAVADWDAPLVWIPKAASHNHPENPNVVRGWAKVWRDLPESHLAGRVYDGLLAVCEVLGEGFAEPFRKGLPNPSRTVRETVAGTGTGTGTGETTLSGEPDRAPADGRPQLELVQPDTPPAKPPDPAEEVCAHWRQVMSKPRAVFDRKRRTAVEARLREGTTAAELCEAIDGCALTPHNMGQNDRGERFNDLELICRSAAHVDRFRGNARDPPRPPAAKGRATNADRDWTAPVRTDGKGNVIL